MLMDNALALKTNSGLLEALRRTSSTRMTSGELFEQRVSFVFGSMNRDNGVTKEQIRQVVKEHVGGLEDPK